MTNEFRNVIGYGGEPIQQSLTADSQDMVSYHNFQSVLGVVLDVYAVDEEQNISAQQSTVQRGWRHACRVQTMNTGVGNNNIIEHVVIPPTYPAGVDNVEDFLPRPSTQSMDGQQFDVTGAYGSFYRFDGDFCVVSFLNGDITRPYISNWWYNPNNRYDLQTTGKGNPNAAGQGQALNQRNRYFKRINGIEHTVTSEGNIYLDTNYAGSSILPTEPQSNGSYARDTPDAGGSLRFTLKDASSFELDWNTPSPGIGIQDEPDVSIRQNNPSVGEPTNSQSEKENTYLNIDKDVLELETPTTISFTTDELQLFGESVVGIASPQMNLGNSDSEFAINGSSIETSISGDHTESSASLDITNTTGTTITSPSIQLGSDAALPLLNSTIADTYTAANTALQVVLEANAGTTPAQNKVAIDAIGEFINAIAAVMQTGQTVITTAS